VAELKSGTTIDGNLAYHKGNHTNEIHLPMRMGTFSTTSESYVEVDGSEILWSPANFKVKSTINPVGFEVYFEAIRKTNGGTVYVELYNKTDSQQIAQLSTTATDWVRGTMQITSMMPTAEKTLVVRIRVSSASYLGVIRTARIILTSV